MPTDVTVMKFKNADGSPRVVTIDVGGVPTTGSNWVLRPHATDPGRFVWEPLP